MDETLRANECTNQIGSPIDAPQQHVFNGQHVQNGTATKDLSTHCNDTNNRDAASIIQPVSFSVTRTIPRRKANMLSLSMAKTNKNSQKRGSAGGRSSLGESFSGGGARSSNQYVGFSTPSSTGTLGTAKRVPTVRTPQRLNSHSSIDSSISDGSLSRASSVSGMKGQQQRRGTTIKGHKKTLQPSTISTKKKSTKNTQSKKVLIPTTPSPRHTFSTFKPKSRLDHLLHKSNDTHAYNSFKHQHYFRELMDNRVMMRIFGYLDWASLWAKFLYVDLESYLQLQAHYTEAGHFSPSNGRRSFAASFPPIVENDMSPAENAQENRERVRNYNRVGGHLIDLHTLQGATSASSVPPNYHNGIMDLDYWNDTAPYTEVLSKLLIPQFWGRRQGQTLCLQQSMNLRNRARGFPQRIALSDPELYFVYDCLTDHVESKFPLRTWYRSFPVWATIQRFEAPCIISVDDLAIMEEICSRGALERSDGSICRLAVELDCIAFNRELNHDQAFTKFMNQAQHYVEELLVKWPLQSDTIESLLSNGVELEELKHFALLNTRLPSNIIMLKEIAPQLKSIAFVATKVEDYELMLREFGNVVSKMEIVLAGNVQPPRLESLFMGHQLKELKVLRAHTYEPLIWEGPEELRIEIPAEKIKAADNLRSLTLYQCYENSTNLMAISKIVQQRSNIRQLLIGSSVDHVACSGKYLRKLLKSPRLQRLGLVGESGAILSKRLNKVLQDASQTHTPKTIFLPASVARASVKKPR
eukprot:CAMPEP_0117452354 /NCGR_PEP_ID=MMETSP0759-20121206/9563_1 /TAXON_ID=63605 /ORGANISM="Percolomonas cosmopolitus, Strain WS" /LENGTH=754 /DNA_ID=CAMNT_0005245149 /DNA_START=177 /DNA_END=2437 /DNA_ORIENTATION=+